MMYFYSLTLQEPQHVIDATAGNFTGKLIQDGGNNDEIVVNCGTQLSLYRQVTTTNGDEMTKVLTKQTFCHVYSVKTLSFPGSTIDYLVITSDSGNITIIDLKGEKFQKLICIPFGRTGMRRFEPGYYLNISPCGRAIFTASLEKYKVAWEIIQTENLAPQLGPPIDLPRSHCFVYCSVALDVGYESPVFAVIERVFKPDKTQQEPVFDPTKEKKLLVLYEVSPSIRSIVRRGEHAINSSASHLVAVPGKLFDCPGGVLVCSTGTVQYFPKSGESALIPLPMRRGKDLSIILKSATFATQGTWFAFLQNQYGDIFVATSNEDEETQEENPITIKYLDTAPLAKSMVILRQGVLAIFGENCENRFYYIPSIEGSDELEFDPKLSQEDEHPLELFGTHSNMNNLVKMAIVPSIYGSISGDIITLHGKGPNSCLKFTRKGISIEQIYKEKLGGHNTAIHTIKKFPTDEFDSFVFITMINQTKVLLVTKDGQITGEFDNSLFITNHETLDVFQLSDLTSFSTVQIHSKGLRVITADWVSQKNWSREDYHGSIVACTSNKTQIVVAYDDKVITLFEANEFCHPTERSSMRMDSIEGTITALALPQPPEGIRAAKWLAVASDTMTVFIISLGGYTSESTEKNDDDMLSINQVWKVTARKVVQDPISSLSFLHVSGIGHILHIGHSNGVLQRAFLDDNEGLIENPQMRFLGHSPVAFSRINIQGQSCLLANSASPYLIRGLTVTQFAAPTFDAITQIYASFCPDGGFIGITGDNDLAIFEINDISSSMSSTTLPLPMTPRLIIHIPNTKTVFLACSDILEDSIWHTVFFIYDYSTNQLFHFQSTNGNENDNSNGTENNNNDNEYELGYCVTSGTFVPSTNEICVGLASNLRFNPRSSTGGRIILINPATSVIHHITEIDDIPGALGIFDENIICGIGKIIRVYKIGMKQLLRHCESRTMPFFISFVSSDGLRIVVGDMAESYHFLKFDRQNSIMTPFCDDATPRFPLSSILLDHSTVASGDRFGNFTVLRVPTEVSDEAEIDPSGVGMIWEHRDFSGAPNKFDIAASFHVGDPITAMQLSDSRQCIIYATVGGMIGAMVPLSKDSEASILKKLEREMRKKEETLCGRVHELYRSYYTPLTNVTDGDLLKRYMELSDTEQREIANSMKCTPFDISRLLVFIDSLV